uniref:Ala_racemase_C domain-containing protein n=1 Tax=Steinernema glaseri TaxID=37863 RepID=A0A1I8AR69_9BILA
MRPARALIDLQALRHNYQLARELTGAKALAVIKADAYGHGAVRCAQALEGEADGFAVACIEEALELRAAGIKAPVLLLEGIFEASELPLIAEQDLWCVVHSLWQLEAIEQAGLTRPITVWLKLDTGMHRVGLHPKDYHGAYQRLLASGKVARIVLMSHFARADELDSTASSEQVAVFEAARQGLSAEVSLRNSPAVLGWPQVPSDWVRPGIMLYGATPFEVPQAQAQRLQPLIGRVSMDMLCIDLTDVPEAGLGSPVELWGKHVLASDVAIQIGRAVQQEC